jgi:glutamate-1-semialdehyde 2,1-aminomutase
MTNSAKLFERACEVIPGGVNSPVRAFNSVDAEPIFIQRGSGSKIYDVDANEYIDFCGSWGPLILGHADPEVLEAVATTAINGLSFGTCNPLEVEMAELLADLVPHAEMFRLVSSGTEAVMTALRLARGYTERKYIIKFDGCYHGHSDCLLINAGSGLLTQSVSSSKGVTDNVAAEVISLSYNNCEQLQQTFAKYGDAIAAVIIEPVAGNMGLVKPEPGFLESVRQQCSDNGSLLIFDEVITGFRFHPGAYASLTKVTPDITTFGKIIGGGMPIGAIGANREIMEHLAPLGEVYQAGTLSGNPVAVAAGIATLKKLQTTDPYPRMARLAELFATTINNFTAEHNIAAHCANYGSAFTLFFTNKQPLTNLDEVKQCDTTYFAAYYKYMLDNGFYMSPSQFELNFVSAAHTQQEIEATAAMVIEFLATRIKL